MQENLISEGVAVSGSCRLWPALSGWLLLLGLTLQAASPGNALRFNGANTFVFVTNNAALNAYPLTVTVWFRTTNSSIAEQGLASKYRDSSADGWALVVQTGHLRGWMYRNGNFGNFAIDATAVSVADGYWHHAALTIDASGGKLYLDGVLLAASAWAGAAGGATSVEPLQIGRYSNYPNTFQGDIDEVTVWNRALGSAELNYVKHRPLTGTEDGLLGLWHFDEGAGLSASDSTAHGYTGLLTNAPIWVTSSAPLVFNPVAGNALKLDGVDDHVSVPHTAPLDIYPLTITAWVKTSLNAVLYTGIVSKYPPGGLDGYSFFLYQGHVRAWYFRNNLNYVFNPSGDGNGVDGGAIADGNWHHVAFVVSPTNGTIYVDGTAGGSLPWTGTAGPCSTTVPLLIGRFSNTAPYTNTFPGTMDEVTLWNRALATTEVQTFKNLPLAGNEGGLIGYWRLDEASGTTATDATGLGHDGTLLNGAVRIASTAFLGDGTSTIYPELGPVQWTRTFAVATIPAQRGFAANAPWWVRRLDDFGAPGAGTTVTQSLQSTLQSTLTGPVPVVNNPAQSVIGLGAYNAAAPQPTAGGVMSSTLLNIEPQNQLDSINDTFQLTVSQSYAVNGGPPLNGETAALPATTVLHFDGNLNFGSIQTTFTNISNIPSRGSLSGGGISTSLKVVGNSGTVTANPAFHYGSGTLLPVILLSNGDAQAAPGTVVSLTGADTDCIQNICYTRTGLTLSNDTFRGLVTLQLPIGVSVCTNFNSTNRLTVAQLPFPNTLLNISMQPQPNSLVNSGNLALAEETRPIWYRGTALNWLVNAGQILMQNPTGVAFVRQEEDDAMSANQAANVEPDAANRISNDGYYRNAGLGSNLVSVVADANGLAHLSMILQLNPPELRPHFPYSGRTNGTQIPTTAGGRLVIQDGLIDQTGSYVALSAAVPVAYARDCFDTNCSSASITAAVLAFSANGNLLNFTPDGGLLAYGSVPAADLTWGYAGSGHFAQRASTVQAGAWHMAGTSLRSNQTAVAAAQRPAVLLLSGFGDEANPAYVERPGQANYPDGFANYAGVNFRAPAQGQSYIGKQNAGPYPLTPRSKYYARFGGVSGIHEAASFPATQLMLYGYPFTFNSYRLSYLDSENWESRTDGAVSLPGPANFTVEFARMKFVCKGDLDSAQVAPFTPPKQMAYWHTWITLESIDFHPSMNDVCGASDRFLVLGVETKLPFLGQAFHATLGFKNNGNLVTAADSVVGVDSRFPIPGHLTLQGPGTSRFPLETAGDGYFNNWETANTAGDGFYNIAGKLRVPFFTDIKVHLHVTPSSPTNAHIDIMGGWPSADGEGDNLGWNSGTGNYFNKAKFDPHADGFPTAVGVNSYRAGAGDNYHPRAQRDWIQVAKFDYPLKWNPVLREFAGSAVKPVILPVIDVDSHLKELSPGKVDFDFAQDITVKVPALKVLDFANDAINELNGPINSVSNAIRKELGAFFDTSGLTRGFRSLQGCLREDASGFFRPLAQQALDPAANQIYSLLAEMQRTNAAGFQGSIQGIVTGAAVTLQTTIGNINGTAQQANTVFQQVNQTLLDVDNTIGLFLRVLEKDSSGRHIVREIVKKLVQDQGQELGFLGELADPLVNSLLQDLEPTLAKVESDLRELRGQFQQLQSQIAAATGDFSSAVNAAVGDGNAVNKFLQTAGTGVAKLLANVTPSSDYLTADPGASIQRIREELIVAFLSSPLPANYQQTFRQFMFDDNFLLDQLMDVMFDQINRSIRDGLSSQIIGSKDGIFQQMKGIGAMSQSLLSAKIRGAPTFEGDSLRRIHLDAAVQMNLPDEMHFNAYMDIKELTSQSVPLDCIPPGAPAAEVTLGAKDVPLSWAGISPTSGSALTLTVEGRWTLQSGSVLGIGGLFDIKGESGFKGCTVKEIGATFAIGELENYFAAKAAGNIIILGIPVDIQAGIFAGHACTLEPLNFIDPDCGQVLGNPAGFRGLYVQYGGGISLSEILFGTSSCWLDVQAGVSTAIYYQDGPRSGKIGFRQKDSLDLELACVISGHVDLALGASASFSPPSSYEIDVQGDARLCGKLGACPFCIEGCKGITIKGVVKDGGIDYFIDF